MGPPCLDDPRARCSDARRNRRELWRMALLGPLAAPAARAAQLIVRSSRPQDLETPVSAFSEEFTPNELFFVRSHFGPPSIDLASWKFTVEGLVDKPLTFTLDQLKKLGGVSKAA